MRHLSGSGRTNPLVQRVQRYSNMSAIFRSSESQETPQTSESQADFPMANTFIIPPLAAALPDTQQDDIEAFIASQPPPETRSAPASSPQVAKETVTPAAPSTPVSTPPPAAPTIQRTQQPPTAPETGGVSRLKSVMKRVQRAISGNPPVPQEDLPVSPEANVEAGEPTTAVPPQPNTPATIQREPETPQTPASLELQPIPEDAPAAVQRKTADTTAAPSTTANPETGSDVLQADRLDQVMDTHQEAGTFKSLPTEEPGTTEMDTPATPRADVPTPQPTETQMGQPSQTTTPVTIQREPVASQPASPPPSQPLTPEERDSHRLDKIMRKHREVGNIEPQEGELPASSETDTSVAPPTSVPDLPADASTKPPSIQRETETTPPPAQPAQPLTPEERDSHRLDTIMRKHREAGNIAPTPVDEAGNVIQSDVPFQPIVQKQEVAPTPPTIEPSVTEIESLAVDQQEAEPAPPPQADEPTLIQPQPAPEETAVQRQLDSKTEPTQVPDVVESDNEGETAVSPESPPAGDTNMPLQSAWPVQVVETPTPASVSPPPPAAPSGDSIMRQVAPEEDLKVRKQLDSIPPSQASDSSVQFIRPRKPRPIPPPNKTPTIQREKTADSTPAAPIKTAESTELSSQEETVATEIGELPSDLWRLIGDEPPPVLRQPEPTTQPQPSQTPAFSPTVETNGVEAQPIEMIDPNTVQPALIQRTEATQTTGEDRATEDIVPPTEAPPAPESEQTETEPGEEEINMDELARQVYGEIKERMSIEWERSRGRF